MSWQSRLNILLALSLVLLSSVPFLLYPPLSCNYQQQNKGVLEIMIWLKSKHFPSRELSHERGKLMRKEILKGLKLFAMQKDDSLIDPHDNVTVLGLPE